MIEKFLFLQSAQFNEQGGFGSVLSAWADAGVFEFVIPFLLIFSLVFGILSQLNLFKRNKTINAIIALAVGLMSLQFGFVSNFFSEVFPRLGVGLIVLLVVMILLGLFAPDRTWVTYTLFGAAAVILIVVLANSADSTQWLSTGILGEIDWQAALPWLVLIVLVAVVIAAGTPKKPEQDVSSLFMKSLFKDAKDKD